MRITKPGILMIYVWMVVSCSQVYLEFHECGDVVPG